MTGTGILRKDREFRNFILSTFPCIACHETDSDLIDWHHVKEEDKDLKSKAIPTSNMIVGGYEVLKCVPLCALCHRKIHMNKLCLLPIRL
jgi:hypothetical protein